MPSDKPFSAQQKAQCVAWYLESRSPKQVLSKYRKQYGRQNVPSKAAIDNWCKKFMATGSVTRRQKIGTK